MSAARTATRQLSQSLLGASSRSTNGRMVRVCQSSKHQRWYTIARASPSSSEQMSGKAWYNKSAASSTSRHARTSQIRRFSATATQRHGHLDPPKPGEELHVTIIDQSGQRHTFEVAAGDNLLDIAQANDLEMEGACGGSCACSTCHVIVEGSADGSEDGSAMYDKIPEAEDDENDMLDLAFGLTETSRLGCQIKMSKELDGLVVKLPSATRNLQKSDFEKK